MTDTPALTELLAISPVDGRYREDVAGLAECASEFALIKNRVRVEILYLIKLIGQVDRDLSAEEERNLIGSYLNLTYADAQKIKDIETKGVPGINNGKKTDHDVKSVELFLRDRFKGTSLEDRLEFFHFGLTSEDVSNLAYTLMLKDNLQKDIVPAIIKLEEKLADMAEKYYNLVMPGRTHGQPAIPTTLGKEMAVFADRIAIQLDALCKIELKGKLNGAIGAYSSFKATYPAVNWEKFSREFVESLGLTHNPLTTQIEPHDSMVDIFQRMMHINQILIGFDQDMWGYISDEYIVQKRAEGEVGSSTMPQKINPIKFENSEGNLGISNALLGYFANKLPIARFQRDLSDSTVQRWIGTAMATSLLAYNNTIRGLNKCEPNDEHLKSELDKHWEMLAEPIQQILRREGVSGAYDILKKATQGKKWTSDSIGEFVNEANIGGEARQEILNLSPHTYVGIAPQLAMDAVLRVRKTLEAAKKYSLDIQQPHS